MESQNWPIRFQVLIQLALPLAHSLTQQIFIEYLLCAGACGCYGYSADQQKSLPLWSSGDKEMNAHQDRWRQVSGEKGWGRGGPKAALRRWHCSRELKEMSDEAGRHWE